MVLSLRRPAMNRSFNRENPDILIVMIAEKQIMRVSEEDKGDQRDGPSKACSRNECHTATAPRSNVVGENILFSVVCPLIDAGCSALH
ncbi:hypothetical protein SLE2022_148560 [Rubroshorea leprosula]